MSASFATRTATTSARGTRGFFGSTRSFQDHTNPFSLPLFSTLNAKRSEDSRASGSASAIRRTSFWLAIACRF